ncbi:MAG: hypothetical protein EXS36_06640 [Pedosphaera sp.]|nr:hypothetical protein [Pedosphaera sp.]
MLFSLDGKFPIGGDQLGVVSVFNLTTKQTVARLTDAESWVGLMALSPDGKILAVPSADHRLRLYDSSNWQLISVLKGHLDEVWAASFMPNGRQIASVGKDRLVKVWSTHPNPKEQTSVAFDADVAFYALSPVGETVVTFHHDHTFRRWDTGTLSAGEKKLIGTANSELATRPIRKIYNVAAVSPGGRFLAMAEANAKGQIILWDAGDRRELHWLKGPINKVSGICFSHDGSVLASIGDSDLIELWDVAGATNLTRFKSMMQNAALSCFSADGRFLGIASRSDYSAEVWNLAEQKIAARLLGMVANLLQLRFRAMDDTLPRQVGTQL